MQVAAPKWTDKPDDLVLSGTTRLTSRSTGAATGRSTFWLADAYGGYNGVVAGNEITRAGCWAHLRRKVIEAEKAAPEIAREAIELARALYAVERQVGDAWQICV